MSLVDVKPTFDACLKTLGYKEWPDGFNTENIPSTRLKSAYHVDVSEGQGISQNQNDLEIDVPVTVRLFKCGFRYAGEAKSEAIKIVETALNEIQKPSRRLGSSGIKNIRFNSFVLEPIDQSNDNVILITMEFTASVILGF